MFNLKKAKKNAEETQNQQLEDDRKEMGTEGKKPDGTTNVQLDNLREDEKGEETTQSQLESVRVGNIADNRTTDGQLDNHTSPEGFVPIRTNTEKIKFNGLPINELAIARENEQVKAFNEAEVIDGNTELWDKFIGLQMEGKGTKVQSQVPESSSQLHNNVDRVKELTVENAGKGSLKEMVMASLKDADAMLLHIYYTADSQDRELTTEEKTLVAGINADKLKISQQVYK